MYAQDGGSSEGTADTNNDGAGHESLDMPLIDNSVERTVVVADLWTAHAAAFHRYANHFPLIEQNDFEALVADIRAHGQRDPITRYQGTILDGRNRYLACLAAGGEPLYGEEFQGTEQDALEYVVSKNLKRRQLTPSQKAMVAVELEAAFAELAKQRMLAGVKGEDTPGVNAHEGDGSRHERRADTQAAKAVGVGQQLVARAKKVAKEAPALAAKVTAGEMTVHAAYAEVTGKETTGSNSNGTSTPVVPSQQTTATTPQVEPKLTTPELVTDEDEEQLAKSQRLPKFTVLPPEQRLECDTPAEKPVDEIVQVLTRIVDARQRGVLPEFLTLDMADNWYKANRPVQAKHLHGIPHPVATVRFLLAYLAPLEMSITVGERRRVAAAKAKGKAKTRAQAQAAKAR